MIFKVMIRVLSLAKLHYCLNHFLLGLYYFIFPKNIISLLWFSNKIFAPKVMDLLFQRGIHLQQVQYNLLIMFIENRHKLEEAELISLKISLLKQSVYPKKRSISLRSQSLKTIIPKQETATEKKIFGGEQKLLWQQKSTQQQPLSGRSSTSLKMTTLQFKTKKSINNQAMPWKTQNWLPRSSGAMLKTCNRVRVKQQEKQQQFLNRIICEAPLQQNKKIAKKYEPKDAQSLLRKNSLFLVNFIKSKQKKNSKTAHVGNVPLILDKLEYKGSQRKEREEHGKKVVKYVKLWKQDQDYLKQQDNNLIHLYPQPW